MTGNPLAELLSATRGGTAGDAARIFEEATHILNPAESARHLGTALDCLAADEKRAVWWARAGLDSFEPDRFFLNLSKLVDTDAGRSIAAGLEGNAQATARLANLLAGSQYLADACLADLALLANALAPSFLALPDALAPLDEEAARAVPDGAAEDEVRAGLARFKVRETLRLTLADLARAWDTPTVLARISDLAAAIIQRALDSAHAELVALHGAPSNEDPDMASEPADFAVLGMGKLGGRELNYSSDVDLVYLYRTEHGKTAGGTGSSVSNPEFFTKLARNLTRILGEPTAHGAPYRVDLDLRPSGPSGDAAIGLRSAEIYYEYWGALWERQAMLKCRGVAGSLALADAFLARIRPFVWKRALDFREIDEIRANKRRIAQSLAARGGSEDDLKLSRGGIREVEFVVQTFQLVYGGRRESLRVRGTLETLSALVREKLMPERDAQDLADAYLFLRELENRVQSFRGRQTHEFPDKLVARAALARKMGLGAKNARESVERIAGALARHRARVAEIFDGLFPESDEEVSREVGARPRPASTATGGEGPEELLAAHPFQKPDRAAAALKAIRDGDPGTRVTVASRRQFDRIAPRLVEVAGALPDPDLALANLEKFVRALQSREALFSTLSDSPEWTESLMTLLGSSEYLSTILIGQPEFLESTFRPEFSGRAKTADEIDGEFADSLSAFDDEEDAAVELRRLKRAEELRVGLRNLLGRIAVRETMAELTALADAVVRRAYALAHAAALRRGTPAKDLLFGVFLLGSAGAGELVFNSDLDLLFLYDESGDGLDPITRMAAATELAERTTRVISASLASGFAYRVDLRLRPEGEHGPLAPGLKTFGEYYRTRASWWERQSLLRLRPVAGSAELARRVAEACRAELARAPFSAEALAETVRMRDRIAEERGKKGARYIDLKMGHGGLIDAEFAAQMLLLANWDPARPDTSSGNTMAILERLHAEGRVSAQDAGDLGQGFLFQKKMENKLRLTYERPVSHLDKRSPGLAFLARLSGYKTPPEEEHLLNELVLHRTRVREAYGRVVVNLSSFVATGDTE